MFPEEPYSWWIFGRPAWHAYGRAVPLTLPALASLVLISLAAALSTDSPVRIGILVLGYLGLALSLLVLVRIALFNRPKRLVPPHAREAPGLLEELRMQGRRGPSRRDE